MKLPALISIPHGGDKIPYELKDNLLIEDKDIFDDIDPHTSKLFDIGDIAEKQLKATIARTFVDLNRSPDQLPPKNPDGVIKSITCDDKPIYKIAPDSKMTKQLLDKYYFPYHRELKNALDNPYIKIAFDCHSMASIGPKCASDKGHKRPLVCLGNLFGQACPDEYVYNLRNIFVDIFNISKEEVSINKPFAGGYITQNYGNNPVPFIQIEINRCMYLGNNCDEKVAVLNGLFKNVIKRFMSQYYIDYNLQ